jgi:hypothetical protein
MKRRFRNVGSRAVPRYTAGVIDLESIRDPSITAFARAALMALCASDMNMPEIVEEERNSRAST